MSLDVHAIQAALRADGLDGWLLYDFHGSNPIASRLAGLSSGDKMATRRWYYLIPAEGEPRGLVHAIEPHNLDALPGPKAVYAGREQLAAGVRALVADRRRLAMEYSPDCAIPYISRVDAGTIDLLRQFGIEPVSSGDLVQRFVARWSADALASHRAASERLHRIKDRAFDATARAVRSGTGSTEYDLQQQMVGWFADEGLVSDSAPVVATRSHTGDPHYLPEPRGSRTIDAEAILLLDLWGKLDEPGAVFADITWMSYTGPSVPQEMRDAFGVIVAARDEAVRVVEDAAQNGRPLRGWEVDRAAREVIAHGGYRDWILHRTGHSLGEEVHGNGVHLDDYETHDDRRLLPGTGFTIEPGVYSDTFGVRTEINMHIGEDEAQVTGPRQTEILTLA
ncbi:MAG: M24 family metallopeptidase [Vicinamibacterales bacterium]|jgi:Xaa-Pro aminopeptidase|nr:hypothetical protein [Acidobacteriota bacterium]MDP6373567.1 M24 family metallopeptidase [Vicinamibacterales bacterium]MDP6607598.1 M24 family metallopeptidase [Vicinamibacterales bacterium]|tara:strand:- start:190 stop:1371 length:1182 start_codon:yes stop_codon:yes gene_type:complete